MAHPQRPRWAPILEVIGVAAFIAVFALAAFRLAAATDSAARIGIALAALPIGYLLADIAAGTMHWFCDSFFEEDTPIIGATFIRGFREHHRDPLSITRHGFFELNGNNSLAVAPVCALLLLIDTSTSLGLAFFTTGFAFTGAAAGTNQLHRWAHDSHPSGIARILQRLHLVLTPDHHLVHHTPPFVGHYCVTSGWMNSALERIRFWNVAERVLVGIGIPKSREA